jgi:hypothetical protein
VIAHWAYGILLPLIERQEKKSSIAVFAVAKTRELKHKHLPKLILITQSVGYP